MDAERADDWRKLRRARAGERGGRRMDADERGHEPAKAAAVWDEDGTGGARQERPRGGGQRRALRVAAEDDRPLARRLLKHVDVVAPRHVNGILTARAVVAEAEGRLDDATADYRDAVVRWREFGSLPEEAEALLGVGRCLLRLARREEAATPLAAARTIVEQLDARPLIATVDEQVAQTTATH